MTSKLAGSPEVRSILIILLGALGDVARASTIVPPLRRCYPGATISWLVETKSAPFVRLNERVDEVYEFTRDRWWTVGTLIKTLRSRRFDIVLDLQRHGKSGLFSLSTGSSRRIGVHRSNAKEFNWIFNTEQCAFVPDSSSKMLLYQAFLTQLGIGEGLDRSGGFRRDQFLPLIPESIHLMKPPFVGVVLGSTWPTKDLPAQGYQQIVSGLLGETGCSVLLLGDKTQAALGEEIQRCHPDPRLLNLAGKTSLPQLMGVLASCASVVGPDSGPGHLSSLVGTPYVTLFGPTDPRRVAPLGSESLAITPAIGCAPCWRRRCPGLNTLCMRMHVPGEIVAQIVASIHDGTSIGKLSTSAGVPRH